MTERCFLSVIGILAAFMALVHGMLAVQSLPPFAAEQDINVYWAVATLGVWIPAICLFCSILGVMIRGWTTMTMLVLSPVVSIGAYFLYSYILTNPSAVQFAFGG
ncbi:hypothetical protein [Parvibaculum sp.]|uniref:hypothetical protein n=1 Tax=Parvibaculum sp. TaxID=2024848 RepID=UPI00320FD90A